MAVVTNERALISIPCGPGETVTRVIHTVTAPEPPQYSADYIQWIVSKSLAAFYLEFTPEDDRIECVLWCFEGPVLRIWTVIDVPDEELQEQIYAAELKFLDKLPDGPSDFSVLYRHGRTLEEIRPVGAHFLSR